jgi:cathepsin K
MKTRIQSAATALKPILIATLAALSLNVAPAQTEKLAESFRVREAKASPELKAVLVQQREFIASRKLDFRVGVTAVSGKKLEEITGEHEIPPEKVLEIQRMMQGKRIDAELLEQLGSLVSGICNAGNKTYDARTDNIVPSIRFQQCGNCWSYSCVGPIECSYIKINGVKDPKTIDLSEMQIVACSGGGNCDGGLTYQAFEWLKNTGTKMLKEADAPDHGTDSPCPTVSTTTSAQLADWGVIDPSGDISKIAPVDKIKEALCKYGPVAC